MHATEPRLLLSLHDVSPRHAPAVKTILEWLSAREMPRAQLLVVPDFHGNWPLSEHPEFCQDIANWRDQGHELVLHGYYHLESKSTPQPAQGLVARFQRRFLTAGEGEFLALSAAAAAELLDDGLAMWEKAGLGDRPEGFIPPAWLHRPDLDPVLWSRGFKWTENHRGIRFSDGKRLDAPVITWASRDPVRRIGSRIYCPSAVRLHANAEVLRIAIHPNDFDHPQLVRSIERTLGVARAERKVVGSIICDKQL